MKEPCNSLRKKNGLVGIVRTKMYLCHSKELMLKDTKSLGNNKAPACESRGFVRKRKKGCILTHLLLIVLFKALFIIKIPIEGYILE